jgi:hypothetical protein
VQGIARNTRNHPRSLTPDLENQEESMSAHNNTHQEGDDSPLASPPIINDPHSPRTNIQHNPLLPSISHTQPTVQQHEHITDVQAEPAPLEQEATHLYHLPAQDSDHTEEDLARIHTTDIVDAAGRQQHNNQRTLKMTATTFDYQKVFHNNTHPRQ